MTLKDIFGKFNGLDIFEKRQITDEYIEVVLYNKQKDKWNKILADILGSAVKPAGINPSNDIKRLAEKYDGIYKNQIMFKKDFDSETVLAMLWPWQDDAHTTLKMAIIKK